jgi:hypothetical protein
MIVRQNDGIGGGHHGEPENFAGMKVRGFETDDDRTFAGADASFLKFVGFIAFF